MAFAFGHACAGVWPQQKQGSSLRRVRDVRALTKAKPLRVRQECALSGLSHRSRILTFAGAVWVTVSTGTPNTSTEFAPDRRYDGNARRVRAVFRSNVEKEIPWLVRREPSLLQGRVSVVGAGETSMRLSG